MQAKETRFTQKHPCFCWSQGLPPYPMDMEGHPSINVTFEWRLSSSDVFYKADESNPRNHPAKPPNFNVFYFGFFLAVHRGCQHIDSYKFVNSSKVVLQQIVTSLRPDRPRPSSRRPCAAVRLAGRFVENHACLTGEDRDEDTVLVLCNICNWCD